MAYCSQCGGEIADDAKFCETCGATITAAESVNSTTEGAAPSSESAGATAYSSTATANGVNSNQTKTADRNPYAEPFDHTSEFDAKDISDNKVYALCPYIFSFVGIFLGVLLAKDSPYVKFHTREATKLHVAAYITLILSSLFCWTCLIPIAGIILVCIFCVLDIIAIVQVCMGKAKEPWLIRSIGALH